MTESFYIKIALESMHLLVFIKKKLYNNPQTVTHKNGNYMSLIYVKSYS